MSDCSDNKINKKIKAAGFFSIEKLNGYNIKIRKKDGYVMASELCKAGDRKFNKYNDLKRTKNLIAKIANEQNKNPNEIVIIKKGGDSKTQGTWIHPLLAIDLCHWISVDFAYWASTTLKNTLE